MAPGIPPIADHSPGCIDHGSGTQSKRAPLTPLLMANPSANTDLETARQNLERVLSREPFRGLKAILDSLSPNREALSAAVNGANSYEELLATLGYRLALTA